MRYVALGDSFTEGVGDDLPGGGVRGWADLVAQGLARAAGEPIHYANLAIRGRRMGPIVAEQLPQALSLSPIPTVMTFNGGGNDMLRPVYRPDRLFGLVQRVIDETASAGIALVIISGPDPSDRLPSGRRMHRLGQALTASLLAESKLHGHVSFVDNFNDPETRKAPYWSADRLHLNALGHRRVAARVLNGMGVTAEAPVAAPVAGDSSDPLRSATAELRYYREHVLPWLTRRARRRSSGDGRVAKRGQWTEVSAGEVWPDE
ncbi:SGNH/GDSL hydrolase family protein [Rarobacter faecitabidus]|uniref:Lysophospholipase L1-like esterase n=1 Tax=Rarobacter faecitabidus TaxID=13243 RepID=A0A542ZNT0_RARFA|nr:SGNH/GDSL hydrolase family protein [Rarobacter faecitabidus]TQL62021.1 lysophospholipase L1-like esterase [Rarobacter faecitabidus]